MEINESRYDTREDEIDLLDLFNTFWNGRKTIIRFVIIFGSIGFLIAIFSPKEYQASTIVVPQTSNNKLGGSLGGLAAIAGINLGGGDSEGVPPSLYPKIVQSIPFQKALLEVPLKFSDLEKKITYKNYYTDYIKNSFSYKIKEYSIGLPRKLIGLFSGKKEALLQISETQDSIYVVSKEEKELFDLLQSQLIVNVNDKEGFIQISFSMPEALPAAQMTKKSQDLLQKAITKFKIQKVQEQYNFIEDRYNEVKKEFIKKQSILANFRDKNQGLILSRSQSYLEQLQSDYNLVYGVYSELAKQLEAQKIKLKENTPVFTILEPVSVPVMKSKPKRALILIVWIILGVVVGIGVIFFKEWIVKFRKKRLE